MYLIPSYTLISTMLDLNKKSMAVMLNPILNHVPLVEKDYYDMYPDVKKQIDSGVLVSARQHYVNNGYFEDRLPFKISVDEIFYLEQYEDIREVDNLNQHYIESGYKEGRIPFCPEFDMDYINNSYPNWKEHADSLSIEKTVEAYYLHYGFKHLMLPRPLTFIPR
jgi:hypothetical protein